jgi:hypothetical protein
MGTRQIALVVTIVVMVRRSEAGEAVRWVW